MTARRRRPAPRRLQLPGSARARGRRRAWTLTVLAVCVVALVAVAFSLTRTPKGHTPASGRATGSGAATVTTGPTHGSGSGNAGGSGATDAASTPDTVSGASGDGIKISTFLGGALRRSYGVGPAPSRLGLIWKTRLGSGQTQRKIDNKLVWWAGTGWTGQCTVVRDGGRDYLLINGYDHRLHKIDARTGKVVWEYEFDDVIKSTNTVFANPHPTGDADRIIVVAGSRRGWKYDTGDPRIMPLRAVSFVTGKELWRFPIPKTVNYSQDVDSSPLLYKGVLYAAVESGYVYALDPFHTKKVGSHREPVVLGRSPRLFTDADAQSHPDIGEANVAIEASPSRIGDTLYIACGSGHVYGLHLPDLKIVWDFRTGTDLDGSAVVGSDGKILQAVEKEYTKLRGGVWGLDPTASPASAPEWYYPTDNRGIAEWSGGVVGSVAVSDQSNTDGAHPRLAAFVSVDGYLRVIAPDALTPSTTRGPGSTKKAPVPTLVFKDSVGAGISTPIIVGESIVAAGYDRKVHLYRITYTESAEGASGALRSPSGAYWTVKVTERATFTAKGPFEATPIVWGKRVYIGSRDGYLYCLGDN